MSDLTAELKDFKPQHQFLIAIDSDGCAFDTMEIKHKECFIPNIVKYWHLQPVSKYARAAAEFVNLYSRWRGVNRFPALTLTFDLLQEWPDVRKRKVEIPAAASLRAWIERESKLGNPALEKEVERSGDPILKQTFQWSKAVNESIADLVQGVPPFPFVRECLKNISKWADVIVCSATPYEALRREWEEHDIARYVRVIAGQEMGSKKEHLCLASEGKYSNDGILMVGDAPGDMKAAKANDAFFFPINPGHEDESWERFFKEGAEKFQRGAFDSAYESKLIQEFESLLPERPPWKE